MPAAPSRCYRRCSTSRPMAQSTGSFARAPAARSAPSSTPITMRLSWSCSCRWRSMKGAAIAGGDALWSRFQQKDPFRYRREILGSTLHMIRQRPWTGFGLGTYATVYPEFATFDVGATVDHAHSDWAEWTAEGGVPMLVLMLSIAAATFRPALRSGWALG